MEDLLEDNPEDLLEDTLEDLPEDNLEDLHQQPLAPAAFVVHLGIGSWIVEPWHLSFLHLHAMNLI